MVSPTRQIRSTERERPSKQMRRSLCYLTITLLLAGDVHQNPGPNFSCSGDPRSATDNRQGTTIDNSMITTQQQNETCSPSPLLVATPAIASGIIPMTSKANGMSIHKKRNFLLLQTTNHVKVLWDPHAKSPRGYWEDT